LPVRRALAVLLALPVLASIYFVLFLRRGPAAWVGIALAVGAVAVVAAAGLPAGAIGAPTAKQAPLAASALGPAVVTGTGLQAAMIVEFGAPMDAVSAEGAVRVDPPSDVRLGWSEDGTQLIVEPVAGWRPATYYTITVGTAARDLEGRALGAPVRAGFLTRESTATTLAVADEASTGVAVDSAITLSFDRPVAVASVVEAFRIAPSVPGTLYVATDGPDGGDPALAEAFVWEPEGLFAAKTRYMISLAEGVTDAEGAAVAVPDPITFATAKAPTIVRFRPRAGSEDAGRTVDVSVRFTMPMDRASTRSAFTVEVNDKAVSGRTWFAEDDTVLVFDPEKDFPYDAKVVLRVAEGARSKEGTPVAKGRSGAFSVEAKPSPKPTPKATTRTAAPKPTARPSSATRPTSSSSLSAEKYLLTLMNRERAAKGVRSLAYHAGVSDKVARPYAKKLAVNNVCSHFYGGTVGDRLRAAGYTGYQWAENLGCRYFADPRDAAESLVRFFRSSPSHYTNMVSGKYSHAGIGLWVTGGRLRFVAVFYTP
jgi:uncharacterized protein YkwD